MPRSKEIPDPLPESFETIDEFVEFWDRHSTADYPEAFREVEGEVRVERRHYYRVTLDAPLGAQLSIQAQAQGVTLDTLVNRLLKEHLHHSTHVS
ncbi:MAG: BrnA antitoxin family protein [Ardenticatenaceae bacterium]|nr:BrnA antitoxin family protein [Ardenticatenaceae bacterium]